MQGPQRAVEAQVTWEKAAGVRSHSAAQLGAGLAHIKPHLTDSPTALRVIGLSSVFQVEKLRPRDVRFARPHSCLVGGEGTEPTWHPIQASF